MAEKTETIFGVHAVTEALKANTTINKLYLAESLKPTTRQKFEDLAKQNKLVIQKATNQKLNELTDNQNHQGVVATIASYSYAKLEDVFDLAKERNEDPFIVILDEIEDPHNLGSILRTADAAGVHGIIIPERRAVQLTPTVAKVSTGAIEHVPVVRVTNLNNLIDELKERGVWIFGTDMDGEDFSDWSAKGPTAIVIGNEGRGISALTKTKVDAMITIPMVGHVQSLNASVAAALLIYQGFNSRRNK